ncbi:MAG: DEAD/DEAH box helicase [Candidatus Methanomethylophilaceae archaeon]|nr:DEAD/DEAH box helicase [Candidatus Methanomethylophilaceae archaeon]
MATFSELCIGKRLCAAISDMGWTEPTPIQVRSVPEGMAGRDLFGQAQTGTGKTGAYAMIALGRTRAGSRTPTTVVMTPTRELADQVSKEMRALSSHTKHRVVAVYGGASISDQVQRLEEGCDVVVGTPGRILDLHGRGVLVFDAVRELVIDEADRMLDMGFMEDMETIISLTPESRQTLLYSATLSEEVRGIAGRSMRDPVEVSVSRDDVVSDLVRQYYVEVKRNGKMDVLRDIMANGDPKIVIFCSTKKMVDDLYEGFSAEGMRVGALHGDLPQFRRDKTIRAFRDDRMNVLIATDVAARGLDIDNIECVVNYDAPLDPETYTHRIGRAGRAGRTGVAVTFVTPMEDRRIPSYEAYMGREVERVTRRQVQNLEISNPELKAITKERRRERRRIESSKPKVRAVIPKEKPAPPTDVTVLSLDIGKSSEIDRTTLSSYVMSCSGIGEGDIGRIGMGSDSSFVEVSSDRAADVIRAINSTKLRGRRVRADYAPEKRKCRDKLKDRA